MFRYIIREFDTFNDIRGEGGGGPSRQLLHHSVHAVTCLLAVRAEGSVIYV